MALYDFVALAVWLVLLPGIKRVGERRFNLEFADLVFISVALLIVLELAWLRIGYSAP